MTRKILKYTVLLIAGVLIIFAIANASNVTAPILATPESHVWEMHSELPDGPTYIYNKANGQVYKISATGAVLIK